MGYHIDFSDISIDEYCETIKQANLVPSRMLLKHDVELKLKTIKQQGIRNVLALKKALNTKQKVLSFSKESGIDANYLTVLIREINSNCPKPIQLSLFGVATTDELLNLERVGITNSKNLYSNVLTEKQREHLAIETNVSNAAVLKLSSYSDLVRIRWVNHTFAYLLFTCGYSSAKAVSNADYNELFERIIKLNKKESIYKANIGKNDIHLCIEAAKIIPFEIEF